MARRGEKTACFDHGHQDRHGFEAISHVLIFGRMIPDNDRLSSSVEENTIRRIPRQARRQTIRGLLIGCFLAATSRVPKNQENVLCQRFRVPIRSPCEQRFHQKPASQPVCVGNGYCRDCLLQWRQASHEFGVTPLISEAAGILALVVFVVLSAGYLFKAVKHPEAVVAEYRHPVAGNFFGTITIAILLLSSVVAQRSQALAEVMWAAEYDFRARALFRDCGPAAAGKDRRRARSSRLVHPGCGHAGYRRCRRDHANAVGA
ncbi:SLAC1 family transporter [Cupriavidus basilensis]